MLLLLAHRAETRGIHDKVEKSFTPEWDFRIKNEAGRQAKQGQPTKGSLGPHSVSTRKGEIRNTWTVVHVGFNL